MSVLLRGDRHHSGKHRSRQAGSPNHADQQLVVQRDDDFCPRKRIGQHRYIGNLARGAGDPALNNLQNSVNRGARVGGLSSTKTPRESLRTFRELYLGEAAAAGAAPAVENFTVAAISSEPFGSA